MSRKDSCPALGLLTGLEGAFGSEGGAFVADLRFVSRDWLIR